MDNEDGEGEDDEDYNDDDDDDDEDDEDDGYVNQFTPEEHKIDQIDQLRDHRIQLYEKKQEIETDIQDLE